MTFGLKEQLFGALPSDWDVARLKNICSVSADYGANVPADEYRNEGLRFLRTTDINEDGTLDENVDPVFVPSELVEDSVLTSGDLLVSRSGTVGLSYLVGDEMAGTAAYAGYLVRFRPARPRDPRFLYYFTQARPFMQQIDALSTQTTISNFSGRKYAEMLVPVAPPEVERQVANFLDEKIAGIDQLVEDKKRLIDLLEKRRRTLIDYAVTGGLSHSDERRASEVPWFPSLPKGWDVTRIKHLGNISYGMGQPPRKDPDGVPMIRATNISQGMISGEEMMFVDPSEVPEGKDAALKAGDILVVRSGAYTADSAIVPPRYRGAVAGYDLILRPRRIDARYLSYTLLATPILKGQLHRARDRAAQPHLNAEQLGRAVVPVPPRNEQLRIAETLDEECQDIDQLLTDLDDQLDKIREYRTSLITAAVTGQIDVRASTPAVA